MKRLILLGVTLIVVGGCNNSSDPTAQQTATDALVNDGKAWNAILGTITKDGGDVTDSFRDFQITFTETAYTSSGGGDVWPDQAGATWSYQNADAADASTILRQDQVAVQITVVKGDQLTMIFTAANLNPGGRVSALEGEYQFQLKSAN